MRLLPRDHCPVCHGHDFEVWYEASFTRGPVRDWLWDYYPLHGKISEPAYEAIFANEDYVLCTCNQCQASFQKLIPDAELAAMIYDQWITAHEPGLGRQTLDDARRILAEAMTLVAHTLDSCGKSLPSQLAVLDFGAGTGVMAVALKAVGCRVHAYDLAAERQALGPELGVRMVDLADIASNRYDLIHTEQVFEHLPDPLQTGRLLAGALGNGGILKISVPFHSGFERGDRRISWAAGKTDRWSWMPNQPLEHLQYMSAHCLAKFGDLLGLQHSRIPARRHLHHASGWISPRSAAANIGKSFFLERLRNHRLFRKA